MSKVTKNYMLEIGMAVGAIGLLLTILSFTWNFGDGPSWLSFWGDLTEKGPGGNWNKLIMIVGPVVLVIGAWYAGEQLVLRRKFERLLDTPKKSEFITNKRELEELARQLPDVYSERIEVKESEFKSRR